MLKGIVSPLPDSEGALVSVYNLYGITDDNMCDCVYAPCPDGLWPDGIGETTVQLDMVGSYPSAIVTVHAPV